MEKEEQLDIRKLFGETSNLPDEELQDRIKNFLSRLDERIESLEKSQ